MKQFKVMVSLMALLNCVTMWANDGDTFVANSSEGIEITFMVISEEQKTCQVGTGTGISFAVPAINQKREGVLTIPSSVNGYTVVEIGGYAFCDCKLTSIVLPTSLEFINVDAFDNTPLATVTVCSSTPIRYPIGYPIFSKEVYQRATLYVPQGTKDAFKADGKWGRFRNIKEGEPRFEPPTDIAYPEDFGRQYIAYGEPVTININFVNMRSNPVSTISYIPIIDGVEGEERTYEFLEPIAANGEPFTLSITLPDFDGPKAADVLIDITKINGEMVDFGADIRPNAGGIAAVFVPAPDHRVLIRDFTSNGCPWALRSNIGFDKLKEKYGDKIIRASYDLGPRFCKPFAYKTKTPSCVIDEFDPSYDPYYGESSVPLGILDCVERYITSPHIGNLKILSAQWTDASQTEFKVVTEATMGMSDDRPYVIEYILVEDSLKGNGPEWEQLNGYAGQTVDDSNLQFLSQLPYTITDMVYKDVAVGEYGYHTALVEGDVDWENVDWENVVITTFDIERLKPFTYGESQQQSVILPLIELTQSIIQDKSKLNVVAYLRDDSSGSCNGEIIDSYKSSITAYSTGIQSINQIPMSNDVYDLSGRKVRVAATTLDNLPKGMYIYGNKKILVK